ncbi:hypothetical protein [Mesorhizobium sp. M0220]|uniref:hypothetical protein n=1 Tax=Mesorhizobium sp. M0220 TaxID=2956920 RepID=UPI00333B9651
MPVSREIDGRFPLQGIAGNALDLFAVRVGPVTGAAPATGALHFQHIHLQQHKHLIRFVFLYFFGPATGSTGIFPGGALGTTTALYVI